MMCCVSFRNRWPILTCILAGCLMLACLLAPGAALAERRVALVIGNSAYAESPLRNPVNDARALAAILREIGFEVATLENADRTTMQRAVIDFGRRLAEDVVGLFYFAGHGMQVRGANYLIPVKAQVGSEEEIEVEAVDVNYVLARMATARGQFNIVILDACRNNPFERRFRSAGNGLAAINAPSGTLISYATAPGSVAADGTDGNGLFTGSLIEALRQPNLTLEETFKRARVQVVSRSRGQQTPWESSSVVGDFVFRKVAAPQPAATVPAPSPAAPASNAGELAFWNTIRDSRDPGDYKAYLEAFPTGTFAPLARNRVQSLTAAQQVAAAPAVPPRTGPAEPARPAAVTPKPAPAAAATKVAVVAPPVRGLAMAPAEAERFMRANWDALQKLVSQHYVANEAAFLDFRGLSSVLVGRTQLYKVGFQEIRPSAPDRLNLQLLLHAEFPGRYGPNPGVNNFASFVNYEFTLDNGEISITNFSLQRTGE